MRNLFWSVLVLSSISSAAQAADWPQWMGPTRDGVWTETGIIDKFPAGEVKAKWRVPVGLGYSGPAVADGRVYVADFVTASADTTNDFGRRNKLNGKERLLCLDAKTGKELWKYEYDCLYEISYPGGPRTTPTVHGGKVYFLGAEGNLACLDAVKGTVVWEKELKKIYNTNAPMWGFCSHPLVDGNKLICIVGGKESVAVAFDKNTGAELWRALSAKEPGYSAPTIIEAGGTRQLLIWHAEALASLNPENGKSYWSIPLQPNYGMAIMVPAWSKDLVYVGGIVNKGMAVKLDPTKPSAKLAWLGDRDTGIYAKTGSPIVVDGHLYGVCMDGELRCVKMATGERLWKTYQPVVGNDKGANSGTAFLVKNGDRFFIFGETGELTIAKCTPEKYEEISKTKLLEPTGSTFGRKFVWSHPAFAEKSIFARNDKEIICVSLAKE